MKPQIGLILLLAGLASGCTTLGPAPKPVQVVTPPVPQVTGAGITGGGLIGGSLGSGLATADKQKALDAEYKALEYAKGGEIIEWAGSSPDVSGKVKAAQPYRVGSQDCRQYSHELAIAGATTSAKATACRNNDGSWALLD